MGIILGRKAYKSLPTIFPMHSDWKPISRSHSFTEENKTASRNGLKSGFIPRNIFRDLHEKCVVTTHDAVVTYKGGIVIAKRSSPPLSNFYWVLGGRMLRGVPTEKSLALRVKAESGLDIFDLQFAGVERALMPTDPMGHGRGTDTSCLVYFARGRGELRKDKRHSSIFIVKPDEYSSFRDKLHYSLHMYTDEAIRRIEECKKR